MEESHLVWQTHLFKELTEGLQTETLYQRPCVCAQKNRKYQELLMQRRRNHSLTLPLGLGTDSNKVSSGIKPGNLVITNVLWKQIIKYPQA
jgi:hypothetical protein